MKMGTVCASSALGISLIHSRERWHKKVLPTKISFCWWSELDRRLLCLPYPGCLCLHPFLLLLPARDPKPCAGDKAGRE